MVTFSEYCEKQNKLYKALDALIELESTKYRQAINSLRDDIYALEEEYNHG